MKDTDFSDMKFIWFTRVENVHPEMWQIYIEAVATPHNLQFASQEETSLTFSMGLAIRGKHSTEEDWDDIF